MDKMSEMGISTYDFHGSTMYIPKEVRFATLKDVESYVNRVIQHPDLSDRVSSDQIVTINPSKYSNMGRSQHESSSISLPDNYEHRREILVLHELAHMLASSGHGESFRAMYYKLLRICMGYEIAFIMRDLIERGV